MSYFLYIFAIYTTQSANIAKSECKSKAPALILPSASYMRQSRISKKRVQKQSTSFDSAERKLYAAKPN